MLEKVFLCIFLSFFMSFFYATFAIFRNCKNDIATQWQATLIHKETNVWPILSTRSSSRCLGAKKKQTKWLQQQSEDASVAKRVRSSIITYGEIKGYALYVFRRRRAARIPTPSRRRTGPPAGRRRRLRLPGIVTAHPPPRRRRPTRTALPAGPRPRGPRRSSNLPWNLYV